MLELLAPVVPMAARGFSFWRTRHGQEAQERRQRRQWRQVLTWTWHYVYQRER